MKIKVLARFVPIALSALLTSATMAPASAQETQPAPTSTLTGVTLPANAVRILEKSVPADLSKVLKALTQASGPQMRQGRTEVLAWAGDGYDKSQASELMGQVTESLQETGWQYSANQEASQDFTLVTLMRTAPTRKAVVGLWAPTDGALILAWTEMIPATSAAPTSKPAASKPATARPQTYSTSTPARTTVIKNGRVPVDLLGKWRWTTISGSNYVDRTTGMITDNAGGMSVNFVFEDNGHYKFNFYIRQRTYGLITEAYSTHEGTVTFQSDRFILHPTKGHYRGSSTGGKVVNRAMSKAEMQKNNVYFWKWVNEDGKRQLKMGPTERSLSSFKRE